MTNWSSDDLEQLMELLDAQVPDGLVNLDVLQEARVRAYLYRRRNKFTIRGLSGKEKAVAIAHNKKVGAIAREKIAEVKLAIRRGEAAPHSGDEPSRFIFRVLRSGTRFLLKGRTENNT